MSYTEHWPGGPMRPIDLAISEAIRASRDAWLRLRDGAGKGIVLIEDAAGERYRIFPDGRAARIDVSDWADLGWIEACEGSRSELAEIVPFSDGLVELLNLGRCDDCDGEGETGFEITFDGYRDGGRRCSTCGGHGKVFEHARPVKSVRVERLIEERGAA